MEPWQMVFFYGLIGPVSFYIGVAMARGELRPWRWGKS